MPHNYAGWAYVSCSAAPAANAGAQGPTGSLQFHTGSRGISGSANLIYLTASSDLFLTGNMLVSGNLLVSGTIRALNYDVVNHTITYLSSSGDSNFGDTDDDLHAFTGSVAVREAGGGASVFSVDVPNSHITLGAQCTDIIYSSGSLTASCGIKVSASLNLCPSGILQTNTINACSPLSISASQIGLTASIVNITGTDGFGFPASKLQFCDDDVYIKRFEVLGHDSLWIENAAGPIMLSASDAITLAPGATDKRVIVWKSPLEMNQGGVNGMTFQVTTEGNVSASLNITSSGHVSSSAVYTHKLTASNFVSASAVYTHKLTASNFVSASAVYTHKITASNFVSASTYYGDGSNLKNITASATSVADGPIGAIQFREDLAGEISGTAELMFFTSSNTLILTGNLLVCEGTASISNLSGCSDITVRSGMLVSGSEKLQFHTNNRYIYADHAGNDLYMVNDDGDISIQTVGDNINWKGAGGATVGQMGLNVSNTKWIFKDSTGTEIMVIDGASNTLTASTDLYVSGNLLVSGNVSASAFYGDGSNLTGITASAGNTSTTTGGGYNTLYLPFVSSSTGVISAELFTNSAVSLKPASGSLTLDGEGTNGLTGSLLMGFFTTTSSFGSRLSLKGNGIGDVADTEPYIQAVSSSFIIPVNTFGPGQPPFNIPLKYETLNIAAPSGKPQGGNVRISGSGDLHLQFTNFSNSMGMPFTPTFGSTMNFGNLTTTIMMTSSGMRSPWSIYSPYTGMGGMPYAQLSFGSGPYDGEWLFSHGDNPDGRVKYFIVEELTASFESSLTCSGDASFYGGLVIHNVPLTSNVGAFIGGGPAHDFQVVVTSSFNNEVSFNNKVSINGGGYLTSDGGTLNISGAAGGGMALNITSSDGGDNSLYTHGGVILGHQGSGVGDVRLFAGGSGQAGTLSGSNNLQLGGHAFVKGHVIAEGNLNTTGGNISGSGALMIAGFTTLNNPTTINADVKVNANLTASGHVSASTYYGDGSNLKNIPGGGGGGGIFTSLASGDAYTTSSIRIGSTGEPSASIYVSSSVGAPLFRLDATGSGPIFFVTASLGGLRGAVGIGTAAPGAALEIECGDLHLNGADGSTNPEIQLIGNGGIGIEGLKLRYNNGTGNVHFEHTHNSAASAILFQTRESGVGQDVLTLKNGSASVGTTTPTALLHASSSSPNSIFRADGAAGTVFHVSGSGLVTVLGDLSVCAGTASLAHITGCSPVTIHAPTVITFATASSTEGLYIYNTSDAEEATAMMVLSGSVSGSGTLGRRLSSMIVFGTPTEAEDTLPPVEMGVMFEYDEDEGEGFSSFIISTSGSGYPGRGVDMLSFIANGPSGESLFELSHRGASFETTEVAFGGIFEEADTVIRVSDQDGDTTLYISGSTGELKSEGNISASAFYGDGANLTNLPGGSTVATSTGGGYHTHYLPFVSSSTADANATVFTDNAVSLKPASGSLTLDGAGTNGVPGSLLGFFTTTSSYGSRLSLKGNGVGAVAGTEPYIQVVSSSYIIPSGAFCPPSDCPGYGQPPFAIPMNYETLAIVAPTGKPQGGNVLISGSGDLHLNFTNFSNSMGMPFTTTFGSTMKFGQLNTTIMMTSSGMMSPWSIQSPYSTMGGMPYAQLGFAGDGDDGAWLFSHGDNAAGQVKYFIVEELTASFSSYAAFNGSASFNGGLYIHNVPLTSNVGAFIGGDADHNFQVVVTSSFHNLVNFNSVTRFNNNAAIFSAGAAFTGILSVTGGIMVAAADPEKVVNIGPGAGLGTASGTLQVMSDTGNAPSIRIFHSAGARAPQLDFVRNSAEFGAAGDVYTDWRFRASGGGSGGGLRIFDGYDGSGPQGQERITITAGSQDAGGGHLGIGTTTPQVALDVHYTGSNASGNGSRLGDPTYLNVGTGGGEVVYFGTGSTLNVGGVHYLNSRGGWVSTNANATGSGLTGDGGHKQLLGIAMGTHVSSSGMLIRGFFNATGGVGYYIGAFQTGSAVYLQAQAAPGQGRMSGTAPTGSGQFVRVVGYATDTPHVIYFNPDSTYIELT